MDNINIDMKGRIWYSSKIDLKIYFIFILKNYLLFSYKIQVLHK